MSHRAPDFGPADERKMAEPRRLADEVPRWSAGEQHHVDEGQSVDTYDVADDWDPDDVPGKLPRGWESDYRS